MVRLKQIIAATVMAIAMTGAVASTASAVTLRSTSTVALSSMGIESACVGSPSNANCDGVWIDEAGPCWDSSYIVHKIFDEDGGWYFETDLRYSTACQSNFSVTVLTRTGVGLYTFSGKVRRFAGPDGPYLMEHGGWYTANPFQGGATVISPLVYAPHNQASACFSTQSNDQFDCTSLG